MMSLAFFVGEKPTTKATANSVTCSRRMKMKTEYNPSEAQKRIDALSARVLAENLNQQQALELTAELADEMYDELEALDAHVAECQDCGEMGYYVPRHARYLCPSCIMAWDRGDVFSEGLPF
jgi:hypothetical protein